MRRFVPIAWRGSVSHGRVGDKRGAAERALTRDAVLRRSTAVEARTLRRCVLWALAVLAVAFASVFWNMVRGTVQGTRRIYLAGEVAASWTIDGARVDDLAVPLVKTGERSFEVEAGRGKEGFLVVVLRNAGERRVVTCGYCGAGYDNFTVSSALACRPSLSRYLRF